MNLEALQIEKQSIDHLQTWCDSIDNQLKCLHVILNFNVSFVAKLKNKFQNNDNLLILSKKEELKKFMENNACHKIFIDLDKKDKGVIEMARELNLMNFWNADLIFMSVNEVTANDIIDIHKLGAEFMRKSEVLEKIEIPQGE